MRLESSLDFSVLTIFVAGRLPLPQNVPIHFRVLPEFVLEDVIDYLLFTIRYFDLMSRDKRTLTEHLGLGARPILSNPPEKTDL